MKLSKCSGSTTTKEPRTELQKAEASLVAAVWVMLKAVVGTREGVHSTVQQPALVKPLGRQGDSENITVLESIVWQPHDYLISLNSPRTDPEPSLVDRKQVFCA